MLPFLILRISHSTFAFKKTIGNFFPLVWYDYLPLTIDKSPESCIVFYARQPFREKTGFIPLAGYDELTFFVGKPFLSAVVSYDTQTLREIIYRNYSVEFCQLLSLCVDNPPFITHLIHSTYTLRKSQTIFPLVRYYKLALEVDESPAPAIADSSQPVFCEIPCTVPSLLEHLPARDLLIRSGREVIPFTRIESPHAVGIQGNGYFIPFFHFLILISFSLLYMLLIILIVRDGNVKVVGISLQFALQCLLLVLVSHIYVFSVIWLQIYFFSVKWPKEKTKNG